MWDYISNLLKWGDSMFCYDVVPIRNNYRGMGRTLIATELITKQTKKIFKELLELYFGYISVTLESPSESGLIKIIEFCNVLKRYNILCEVIAYDLLPLDNVVKLLEHGGC